MGLFSIFQSVLAFGECTVHVLLARLADRNIDTDGDEFHSGRLAMSKTVKRHGHFWTAIMYTITELLASVIIVFKHGLQGGCKVLLPVVKRRTLALLDLYATRFMNKATSTVNNATKTYLGSFVRKQTIRFTSPCVSVLKLVHDVVSGIYGHDYLDVVSDYVLDLLDRACLVLENAFQRTLDSFTRKSRRSIVAWMLYVSIGIYFTTTLCYASLALAFMSAYTFDADQSSQKGSSKGSKQEIFTQSEQIQRRSSFNAREAQQLREECIKSLHNIDSSDCASSSSLTEHNAAELPDQVEPSPSNNNLTIDKVPIREQSPPPHNTTTITINNFYACDTSSVNELETQSIPEIHITCADESLSPPFKLGNYSISSKNNELENTSDYPHDDSVVDELESLSEGNLSPGVSSAQIDTSGRITGSTKGVQVTSSRRQRRVKIVRSPEDNKENINCLVATTGAEISFEGLSKEGMKANTKLTPAVKGSRSKSAHQRRLANRKKYGVLQPVELHTPGTSSKKSSKASSEGGQTPSTSIRRNGKKKQRARELSSSVTDGSEETTWLEGELCTPSEIAFAKSIRSRFQERRAKGDWTPYIDEGMLPPAPSFEFSVREPSMALEEQDSDEVF